jgi:hypothetical protein
MRFHEFGAEADHLPLDRRELIHRRTRETIGTHSA